MPTDLQPRYQYFTGADIGKLRATGYSCPITPLDGAVRDYVTNYLLPGVLLDPSVPDRVDREPGSVTQEVPLP